MYVNSWNEEENVIGLEKTKMSYFGCQNYFTNFQKYFDLLKMLMLGDFFYSVR